MKFTWIFLWFQIVKVFCTIEVNVSKFPGITLHSTFGHDFSRLPMVGQVILWKISKNERTFKPQEYIKYTTKFESNNTYLIYTQTQPVKFRIYYWLGRSTLLEDKKVAAKYAIILYTLIMEYNKLQFGLTTVMTIYREVETVESESFHNTVNFTRRGGRVITLSYYNMFQDTEFISQYPHLYVVRGDSTTFIKKISVGTSWFKSDTCLVLESGYKISELAPVNMYCGPRVSEKAKSRAEEFIANLSALYINSTEQRNHFIFDKSNRNEPKFKIFLEVLEDSSNYKPYEAEDTNVHLKDAATFVADRNEAVKLFWIKRHTTKIEGTNETKNTFEKYKDETKPLCTPEFPYERETGIGFIFDTSSIAGLFVHILNNNSIEEKVTIIEMMEDYIEEKYSSSLIPPRVRLWESYYYFFVIDFLINSVTWPTNNDMEQAGEHW